MSSGGTSIRFGEALDVAPNTELKLAFPLPSGANELRATAVASVGSVLRVRFQNLTIAEQEVLTMVLYSRADSWLGWGEARESDNVVRKKRAKAARTLPAVSSAIILALAANLAAFAPRLQAQAAINPEGRQAGSPAGKPAFPPPLPGQFRDVFSLADAGSSQIELHGIDSSHTVYFTLPQTHVPRSGRMHISYAFSPSLLPQLSQIKVMMNGTLFGTVQPTPNGTGGSSPQVGEADFNIPPELMVHNNAISIQFIGHYVMVCEDPANTALWARVH